MKIVVIPDCHLKPEMYEKAAILIRNGYVERAVSLMDISDDWDKQYDLELYAETYKAVLDFAKEFPETVFCYGNHDLSYRWKMSESGYSYIAAYIAGEFLDDLTECLPKNNRPGYVRRIDNVLFSHGGLSKSFVDEYVPVSCRGDIDDVISAINQMDCEEMWTDNSPIWLRPQLDRVKMFEDDTYFQVIGHTPTGYLFKKGNFLSCDVFSTDRSGRPIGNCEFLILDTKTLEYSGIAIGSISY